MLIANTICTKSIFENSSILCSCQKLYKVSTRSATDHINLEVKNLTLLSYYQNYMGTPNNLSNCHFYKLMIIGISSSQLFVKRLLTRGRVNLPCNNI